MATHSSIQAWAIPWAEEPGGGYSPCARKQLDITEHTHSTTNNCSRRRGILEGARYTTLGIRELAGYLGGQKMKKANCMLF